MLGSHVGVARVEASRTRSSALKQGGLSTAQRCSPIAGCCPQLSRGAQDCRAPEERSAGRAPAAALRLGWTHCWRQSAFLWLRAPTGE